ncbi:NAD(P)-dependent alcohol dehydrogenase [Microlunatus sp. GCM10028923]|uniref:NAD(P)-dependent alcohol dehydrogenase n=1 Tax=Microlunatus sp. GCM10028923 TaxID=3273400 RepID=UPI0036076DC3
MKAIVATRYGSPEVFRLEEIPSPVPADDEILVRVRATTVSAAHSMMRQGRPLVGRLFTGLRRPRQAVPSTEFAGRVEAVGPAVTSFSPGDEVFGETGIRAGCAAEYVCVREGGALSIMPFNLSATAAAAIVDGGSTSLYFLRDKAKLRPGHRVLINGASGSVGTAAVQLARHLGADVTGVCSAANLDLVRALGADDVIDYTAEDFTEGDRRYDIVFDTVGKSSFARCRRILEAGGVYLTTVPSFAIYPQMLLTSRIGDKRAVIAAAGLRRDEEKTQGLIMLKGLLEEKLIIPVVDRTYPLAQIAEAHRYVDTGRKKGSVVLTVEES